MRIRSKDLAARIAWMRSESFHTGAAYGNAIAAGAMLVTDPIWTLIFLFGAALFGFAAFRARCMAEATLVADIDNGALL